MFCEKCGFNLPEDVKFCPKCGNPTGIEKSGNIIKDVEIPKKHIKKRYKLVVIVMGVIFIAIIVVTVLFVTGKIGDREKVNKHKTVEKTIQPEDIADKTNKTDDKEYTDMETDDAETEYKAQEAYKDIQDSKSLDDEQLEPEDEAEETTEQVDMAFLEYVTASSELFESNVIHSADRICDGSLKKAWVEGKKGQGKGENVSFVFEQEFCFYGMKIYAGYQKSKDLYYKNSRPKKLKLIFSDGSVKNVQLKDTYGVQKIEFDEPIVASEVSVIIKSVYKGNKYSDTVISELSWF